MKMNMIFLLLFLSLSLNAQNSLSFWNIGDSVVCQSPLDLKPSVYLKLKALEISFFPGQEYLNSTNYSVDGIVYDANGQIALELHTDEKGFKASSPKMVTPEKFQFFISEGDPFITYLNTELDNNYSSWIVLYGFEHHFTNVACVIEKAETKPGHDSN